MRSKLAGMILVGLLAFGFSPAADAGPKDEAIAAVQEWVNAYNSNDLERLLAMSTPDALLPTISPILASKPDDVRGYFRPSVTNKTQMK